MITQNNQSETGIYIALLRGINVGGHNKLPMKNLINTMQNIGLKAVRTYIQSGNVIFNAPNLAVRELAQEIEAAIEDKHGFRPPALVYSLHSFEAILNANPFPDAVTTPNCLHLYFLENIPKNPDLAKLKEKQAATETFNLSEGVFYLHAPDGIGRSKLAAQVERALGVPCTARNWRSVTKILELASEA